MRLRLQMQLMYLPVGTSCRGANRSIKKTYDLYSNDTFDYLHLVIKITYSCLLGLLRICLFLRYRQLYQATHCTRSSLGFRNHSKDVRAPWGNSKMASRCAKDAYSSWRCCYDRIVASKSPSKNSVIVEQNILIQLIRWNTINPQAI